MANQNKDNDLTLDTYNKHIQEYVAANKSSVQGGLKEWIDATLELIPKGGRILEIGSGYGKDADYIESLGYEVTRTDAAQGFVDLLKSNGHEAKKLNALTDGFGDGYDMVFAQAVFLHFSPAQLKMVLSKSLATLKSGGILAFSVKQGDGSDWVNDYLQAPRYFHFWQEPKLRKITEVAGFHSVKISHRSGSRAEWLYVTAQK